MATIADQWSSWKADVKRCSRIFGASGDGGVIPFPSSRKGTHLRRRTK